MRCRDQYCDLGAWAGSAVVDETNSILLPVLYLGKEMVSRPDLIEGRRLRVSPLLMEITPKSVVRSKRRVPARKDRPKRLKLGGTGENGFGLRHSPARAGAGASPSVWPYVCLLGLSCSLWPFCSPGSPIRMRPSHSTQPHRHSQNRAWGRRRGGELPGTRVRGGRCWCLGPMPRICSRQCGG